jgi:hypothetical protein
MEKNIINIDAHVIDDIRTIITRARNKAYQSINETLIRSNWDFPDWEILHTRVQNLSWSHLRCILRVER